MTTLAERLGYGADERVLIINCDDFGMSHAANLGCLAALRDGVATSASLMVPCPWSRDAAGSSSGLDVGVHLTLNAECDTYRWGPITQAPSLLDGNGGFPSTVSDVWDHADLDEVRRECRAQIERSMLWGVDVTHLDSHMGTLQLRPEFFDVYVDLAVEFELPVRMAGASAERSVGFTFRSVAADARVVFPDHLLYVDAVGSRDAIEGVIGQLQPGVTEVYVHPAVDTPELRAIGQSAEARIDDLALMVDPTFAAALDEAGVRRIGWAPLRDLMRKELRAA